MNVMVLAGIIGRVLEMRLKSDQCWLANQCADHLRAWSGRMAFLATFHILV